MKQVIRYFSLLLILWFLFNMLASCTKKTVKSDENDYTLYTNLYYGEAKRNYMDVCIPTGKSGTVGLILMIHGGGWIAGDKDCYTASIKSWCGEKGYVSAAINYRYADGKNVTADDILDDISMALMKIKELAAESGITVEKVLLTGGSAGAHLSLLYAYEKAAVAPIAPVAVVSFSGPTDLCDTNFYKNGKEVTEMVSKISGIDMEKNEIEHAKPLLFGASPVAYVNENTVPTVICHGANDSIVPYSNAETLDRLLTEYGVPHDFIVFPNSDHGLESDSDCMDKANELMEQYAARYLNSILPK